MGHDGYFGDDFACCADSYDARPENRVDSQLREAVRLTLIMKSAGIPDDTITDVVTEYIGA